jgi:lipopolysaccharide export system protein LptC
MVDAPASAGASTPTRRSGQRRVRRYSRLVFWMKVALPLGALAVVAVIYFGGRDPADLSDLFTADELATLGAGLRLDNPRFAGVTDRGEAYSVEADWALPDSPMPLRIDLEKPRAEIDLEDGRKLTGNSTIGHMLRVEKRLVLEGRVVLDTSDGYHMETERLELDMEGKLAHSPGPVRGYGPNGTIESGSLRAEAASKAKGPGKIWFENRVRLVFSPGDGAQ